MNDNRNPDTEEMSDTEEMPEMSFSDLMAFLDEYALVEAQKDGGILEPRVRSALEFLLPIIDNGIDIAAIEAAMKSPALFGHAEGQHSIRHELIQGVLAAFSVFGVTSRQIDAGLWAIMRDGWVLKQDDAEIAARLPYWNPLTVATLLYGPEKAGRHLYMMEVVSAAEKDDA